MRQTSKLDTLVGLHGGLDWLAEQFARGEFLRTVAARLRVDAGQLAAYIDGDPQRRSAVDRARSSAALLHVEDAVEIVDTASPLDVPRARARADIRLKLAKATDPERFGDRPSPINVNVGDLFLTTLQSIAAPRVLQSPAAPRLGVSGDPIDVYTDARGAGDVGPDDPTDVDPDGQSI